MRIKDFMPPALDPKEAVVPDSKEKSHDFEDWTNQGHQKILNLG